MPRKSLLAASLIFASAVLSAQARAQVYIQAESASPYVALTSIPGITGVTPIVFDDDDEGEATVPIPFSFQFIGTGYTSVRIGTNGIALFGTDFFPSYSNYPPGSASSDNNVIWVWWDDLVVGGVAGVADYGLLGTAPNRTFVIEVRDWEHYSFGAPGEGRWQLWLFEGQAGRFEVHYGGLLSAGEGYSASVGWEGPAGDGVPFDVFRPCANTADCDSADYATMVDRAFGVELAQGPELLGSVGSFGRGVLPGGTATGPVVIRNVGTEQATNVTSSLYLSLDPALDAGDRPVGTIVSPSIAPGATLSFTATITIAVATPRADYYLFLRVDSADSVAEAEENNNVAVSATRFATGPDISPTAAIVPAGAEPGQQISFNLTIANQGVSYTGPAIVRVLASPDPIFDLNDPVLGTTSVTLTGAASQVATVVFTVPALVPGSYYPIFRLDPSNQLLEIDETNNTLVPAGRFLSGPDLAATAITVPANATPGLPLAVTTRISSLGATFSGALSYRLYVSSDGVLDAQDPVLGNFTVNFTGQPYIDDVRNPNYVNVPPGTRSLIARVDPLGVLPEANELNNVYVDADEIESGSDFRVTSAVATPDTVDPDQILSVSAQLLTTGSPFTGAVPFRLVLSDFSLSPDDPVIYDGTTFVTASAPAAITASVALGSVTPPIPPDTSYYVYVVVDPDNTIPELNDGNNNTYASSIQLNGGELVAQTLTGASQAFIGVPYRIQLSVDNIGLYRAAGFRYAFYLSNSGILQQGTPVFTSQPVTIAAGSTGAYIEDITLPPTFQPGSYLLGVVVDSEGLIPEESEANNLLIANGSIQVLPQVPDLSARIISTATSAGAGEQLAVTRIVENVGVAASGNTVYRYYLSSDVVVGSSAYAIGEVSVNLPVGGSEYAIDTLRLPATIPPGNYWLALVADPDNIELESNEANNLGLGPRIPIYAPDLAVYTNSLPDAVLGARYEAGLFAVGGSTAIVWSQPSGALPPGLTLTASTGVIRGTPQAEATFSFTVRATAGTVSADRALTLRVVSVTLPLAVATQTLPIGFVSRPYATQLVAVGGRPPFVWTVRSALPDGMTLSADGAFAGTPSATGSSVIQVHVSDDLGGDADGTVSFRAVDPSQTVLITQSPLPPGIVAIDYCVPDAIRLFASGGVPPYRWSILADAPPGITLDQDGNLCGTPSIVGRYDFVAAAQDMLGIVDTALFTLVVSGGEQLLFLTRDLPAGVLGTEYMASIQVGGGFAPLTITVEQGALPPGLAVLGDGIVSGTPTAIGDYYFVAHAVDTRGAIRDQPLSIRVTETAEVIGGGGESSGCGCNSSPTRSRGASPLWALALVRALARRRHGSSQ